jgi:hypothetical protein
MQYFEYQGTLCRLHKDAAGTIRAEQWDVVEGGYRPVSTAAVMRNGDLLSPQEAIRWQQSLRTQMEAVWQ